MYNIHISLTGHVEPGPEQQGELFLELRGGGGGDGGGGHTEVSGRLGPGTRRPRRLAALARLEKIC